MSQLAVNSITDANSGNTATINGMTPTADSLQGFRNRIINGDMRIDQRNAGAAVTNVTSAYVLDRWEAAGSTDGAVTIQQSSTAPDGFSHSMQLTAATADASIGAAQYYQFFQKIEGYNIADLMLGTATAKTFTVSFWVRSSKTGTYCATLANSASNRLCPVNFTISSADTWEYKSFTVAGDTTGTWLTTNGIGLFLVVNLALGSNFNAGTSGTWNTTQYGTSSQVNWLDTINATFYITGVQLEVGSVATPFERRPYTTELQLCQRYYEKSYPIETVPGTASIQGASWLFASSTTNGYLYGTLWFKVTKRTNATMNFWSYNGTANVASDGNVTNLVAGSADTRGQNGTQSSGIGNFSGGTISPAGGNISVHWAASAEL